MSLASVNTVNKFLASASNTDFIHGSDADRYKTFANAIATGGIPVIDNRIVELAYDKIKSSLTGISEENIANMKLMLGSSVAAAFGVGGNLMNRVGLDNMINTICGNFDLRLFGKFSLNIGMIGCLALSGLTASLLCMGIKGALSSTFKVSESLKVDPRLLACVVGSVLQSLGFNPNKNITIGLSIGVFKSPMRSINDTRIDISDIINDVKSNPVLLEAFKGTETSELLLTGSKPSKSFKDDLDTLLPEWNTTRITGSRNIGNNLEMSNKSKPLETIDTNVKEIKKEDYMILV